MTFRVLGFPVELQNGALFLAGVVVLFGLRTGAPMAVIFGTVLIGAVSILVHELGHASAARLFGVTGIRISLHGFGGTTRHAFTGSAARELAVSVAGPIFGFGLAGVCAIGLLAPLPPLAAVLVERAVMLNVAWSVFNLLPIFPMDGGQALGFFLQTMISARTAWLVTHGLGALLGGALAVGAMAKGDLWIAMFGGMFTWQNVQRIQYIWSLERDPDRRAA